MFLLFTTLDSNSKVSSSCISAKSQYTSTTFDSSSTSNKRRLPLLLNTKLRDEKILVQIGSIIAEEQEYMRKSRREAMAALTLEDWNEFIHEYRKQQHNTTTTATIVTSFDRTHKESCVTKQASSNSRDDDRKHFGHSN